ncbi:MAG TPA: sensor histidine kinase N-terminal domain-containing protein, partial [Burkholderiaceae bacterium]|nr:sensor histidine kinase N-terminal domain-containing protein [Burkholderiaceae bacterium]
MTSLRHTLLRWLLVPLVLIVGASSALQYWFTVRPATQALDLALGDAALAVGNLLRIEDGLLAFAMTAETERLLRADRLDRIYFAVLGPRGARIAGDPALAELAVAVSRTGQVVYVDASLDGLPVRAAVLDVECGSTTCQVRIAETLVKRARIQRDALITTTVGLLLLVVAVTIAIAIAVRRGLQPLEDVRAHIARRSLDDLRAIDAHNAPAEVQPLLAAINQLFERLLTAARAQKAFIADAAHQLRTPLTSLKTESELALLEKHPADMTPTLKRVAIAAARAARMAEQLLALARADRTAQAETTVETLDLRQVAAASAEEWVPRAISAGIDLGFDLHAATVHGRSYLLRELLANLIHNALEYAGRGARVTVRTGLVEGAPVLEVEDNGPGIPAAERTRVFERFARGAAAPGTGSGLGLAIVRDIA